MLTASEHDEILSRAKILWSSPDCGLGIKENDYAMRVRLNDKVYWTLVYDTHEIDGPSFDILHHPSQLEDIFVNTVALFLPDFPSMEDTNRMFRDGKEKEFSLSEVALGYLIYHARFSVQHPTNERKHLHSIHGPKVLPKNWEQAVFFCFDAKENIAYHILCDYENRDLWAMSYSYGPETKKALDPVLLRRVEENQGYYELQEECYNVN